MSNTDRPVIMVFCDYYLPGYKSGGGMRTIVNMVARLGDEYDFRIVTRDHDGKLDKQQYTNVVIDEWNKVEGADVYYLSKGNIRMSVLRNLINNAKPDVIYTNSFFSTLAIYVLKLRKLGLIEYCPVIVAPCGELAVGALGLKSSKKKVFLKYARLLRLYSDVIWKASTPAEADEISRLRPKSAEVFVAPDLAPRTIYPDYKQELKPAKVPGSVKIVFLSRFVKTKNFNWIIPLLMNVSGEVELDVIGPMEDLEYWEESLELRTQLPENVKVRALGPVAHEKVSETLLNYHFFLSPTLGENFGHIFVEALASGCPLIISNKTPWSGLKTKRIGWDMPLANESEWERVIKETVEMDEASYRSLSVNARKYSVDWLANPEHTIETNKVLLRSLEKAALH